MEYQADRRCKFCNEGRRGLFEVDFKLAVLDRQVAKVLGLNRNTDLTH